MILYTESSPVSFKRSIKFSMRRNFCQSLGFPLNENSFLKSLATD